MHAIPISTFAGGRPLFNLIVYCLSFSSESWILCYFSIICEHYLHSPLLNLTNCRQGSFHLFHYLFYMPLLTQLCMYNSLQCDGRPNTATVPIRYFKHGPLLHQATFSKPSPESSSSRPVNHDQVAPRIRDTLLRMYFGAFCDNST
jgi:hypothetical protein